MTSLPAAVPSNVSHEHACPCGRGRAYGRCCGRYLNGRAWPASPEALMRARFTAYVLGREDYLAESWHSRTRPVDLGLNTGAQWQRLHVLDAPAVTGETGEVEFIAYCKIDGRSHGLHERSRFVKEDGRWRYLDGETPKTPQRWRAQVGRNDPCLCNSGKKYKHCCGRR